MRIGLQTWGSDGDIRPFMALAGGLRLAGHDVTLAVTSVDHKDYSQLASSLDIELWQVRADFPINLGEFTHRLKNEPDPLKQVQALFKEFLVPLENDLYQASCRLCDIIDLVIGHHVVYPLKTAAQKRGRGYATVILCHQGVPSRHLPPFPLPGLGAWMNSLLWKLAGYVVDRKQKQYYDNFRARHGLAPVKTVIGGKVLNRWKTSPRSVGREVNAICRAPSIMDRARITGESERRENGAARAVQLIQRAFI